MSSSKGTGEKRKREESTPITDSSLRPAPFYYYVDRSKEPDDDPLSPIASIGSRLNLPAKMHVILSRSDLADIVSWMPHGRAWRIHNMKEFESKVIPEFWNKCNMMSFNRQVNAWDFIRMVNGKDKNCYYHEYFLRGLPHLCKKIQRNTSANDRNARREHEPDLYAISKIHPLVDQTSDSYDLEMLRTSMRDGSNGRIGIVQQNMTQNAANPTPTLEQHQQKMTQVVVASPSAAQSEGDLNPLLEQQLPQPSPSQQPLHSLLQQPPQPVLSQSEVMESQCESFDAMVHRQMELSSWQSFLLSFLQMGVGSTNTWNLLTNWWLQSGTTPAITEDEERREFEQMSAEERISARRDLVGSEVSVPELSAEEQFAARTILLMEIGKLPSKEKIEFLQASSRCSDYADGDWLLLFLYSENVDACCAAKKITRYWRLRVSVLGPEKAFMPLTISNIFPGEHIRELKMCYIRALPVTDLHGRSIIIVEPARIYGKIYNPEAMKWSLFYTFHSIQSRPDIAKNGIIIIFSGKEINPRYIDLNLMVLVIDILKCFPYKVKGIHLCYCNKPIQKAILPFCKYFMGLVLRHRMEYHTEVGEMLLNQLRQFGMPPERLPTELGGIIELDQEAWIRERIINELE